MPGAVARQSPDFGAADGTIGAEYFSLDVETDLAPLLAGLDGDMRHSAHWGFVISGYVTVTYRDGTTEGCPSGDVFDWPAGHSVRVDRTAELILFSPQLEHGAVMDHIRQKLADHVGTRECRLLGVEMGLDPAASPGGCGGGLILASMSVMPDPSAYRERTSAVAGVTVWTRVADGSSSWILPDGCIDVLWNGRELTVAGPDTTAHPRAHRRARRTRPCVSLPVWHRPSWVSPLMGFATSGRSSPT